MKTSDNYFLGIFLGYSFKINMEGEGIGNFIVRLVNGFLESNSKLNIIIATTEINEIKMKELFIRQISNFQGKISIEKFSRVRVLNSQVTVDAWIVPYFGLEMALELSKPIILCLHDLVYIHFKEYNNILPNISYVDNIAKNISKKAAAVVFNSNYIRNNEGEQYLKLPKEKMYVIRLAAPTEEYKSFIPLAEKDFRSKYKLYDDYVTFPSVLRPHKNHNRLIAGFLQFRKTIEGQKSKLKLVFTDDNIYRFKEKEISNLLNSCIDLEAKNSIIPLGRVPSQDLPSLYKYAKGTIIPTLFEGSCPFPLLESLIVNTPVAIGRIEVTEEIVTDLNAFIHFNPNSINDIAQAISDLWKTDKAIAYKQKRAISKYLNRCWKDVANEYFELFLKIRDKRI